MPPHHYVKLLEMATINGFFKQRAEKVSVLYPWASGFCNKIIGLVMFFEEFEQQKNCVINSARQKVFGASWNDVWASKY